MLHEIIPSDIESSCTSRTRLNKVSSAQYYDPDHPVQIKEFEMPSDSLNITVNEDAIISHKSLKGGVV